MLVNPAALGGSETAHSDASQFRLKTSMPQLQTRASGPMIAAGGFGMAAALAATVNAFGRQLRCKVVKFEGHYHGWFDTILVSVAPPLEHAGPELAPTPHLPSAGQSAAAARDVEVPP